MPTNFFVGLDLGQARDYTALAIAEKKWPDDAAEPAFFVRHLQRYPLGTSYPSIVAAIGKMLDKPPLNAETPTLVIDGTGVGAAVADLFRREQYPAWLEVVIITGGDTVTKDPETDVMRVPKRDLVGAVQVGLQTGRLKIAKALPEAATLQRELENFQVKITDAAHDAYGAWREGTHDDLVLATALALWFGMQPEEEAIAPFTGGYRGGVFVAR